MPKGSRPGERRGGRKKGTPNKATVAKETALKNAAQGLPTDHTSLQLFQSVYRDAQLPLDVRMSAAKSALPYEHPSLASVEFMPGGENMMDQRIKQARGNITGRLARLRSAQT